MSREHCSCCAQLTAGGESGEVTKVGAEWLGWSGFVAHPNAPAGGGGPGHFAQAGPAREVGGDLGSPWRPGPAQLVPMQGAPAPTSANAAPVTVARSLGMLKAAQSALLDVNVDAEVIADGAGGSGGAHTSFSGGTQWSAPGYTPDKDRKIVRFDGKFTWRGTVILQTLYAAGARPNDVSCYGRGTTVADVRDRNITLGFHESCHRDDFVTHLTTQTLPDPPKLAIGMTEAEYRTATSTFRSALETYFKTMEKDSVAKTDEVGHRRSTWLQAKKCFRHLVP